MSALNIEVDSDLKNKAEKILTDLGYDLENVVVAFLYQIVSTKSIPFDI